MGDKLATFRLDGDLWEAFKNKADSNGTNASRLLKAYVKSYLTSSTDSSTDARIDSSLDSIYARLNEVEQRLGKLSENIAA